MRSFVPAEINDYISGLITTETQTQRRLREETSKLPDAVMQIAPDQAMFLSLLVAAIGAKNAIEIGTFTGYSALAIARALPKDGKLICCDISKEWTTIGQRYWKEAELDKKIDLRIAPALDTLEMLLNKGGKETFDFAFIDADKTGYDAYYEACLKLLRSNGIIAIDNVLWSGAVVDPAIHDANTVALRALNLKVSSDARVEASLLTVGDGVMLVRKR